MAAQATNERIVTLLETVLRQLGELKDTQKQIAADLKRAARAAS